MRLSLSTSAADAGPRADPGEQTLVVDDVRARYGTHVALDGVSLDVRRGERSSFKNCPVNEVAIGKIPEGITDLANLLFPAKTRATKVSSN